MLRFLRGLERLTRFRQIRVRFGAPIPLVDLNGLDPHARTDETTRRLWGQIRQLEAELEAEG